MSGEVDCRGLPFAEGAEEGDHDVHVEAGVASVGKGALVTVLAPVDDDLDGITVCCVGGDGEEGQCKEQQRGDAKKLAG